MKKSMLPYPLVDFSVSAKDIERLLAEVKAGEVTLEKAWSHLLYYAIKGAARRARRKTGGEFSIGAALWAAIEAREALWRIEREGLVPLFDLDLGEDVIYEELAAFGRRALEAL